MIIRPATAADLARVDGELPAHSCRALAAEQDGRVIGVFGIYQQRTRYVMFSSVEDEFRRCRRYVARGVKAMRALIASRPSLPVLANADPAIQGSDVLLAHMGFTHLTGETWQWPGFR